MSITETIPSVSTYSGVVPDKATQTKTEFANNVQPYLNYINATFVVENSAMITSINTWTTEANALSTTVNQYLNQTKDARNDAINAKNEAVLAKDEIKGYVIPTNATYSPTTIKAIADMAETLNLTGAIQ